MLAAEERYSATNVRNICSASAGSYNGFYRRDLSCMKMQEADDAFDEEEGHANGIILAPSGRV